MHAFLAPSHVVLTHAIKGIKPAPPTRYSAECGHESNGGYESPLAQLEQMIADANGADLIITLSNHFVRYATLAPQKNIANPAELQAYAGFHMREIFGERAADWTISVSAWDPLTGGVCAGLERSLFERLEELAERRKMGLKYVEPYLTAAFDHWRKRFDHRRAWFALVETGRLCLVLLEKGGWQRVSNQRIVEDVKDELLATLDQEAILFSQLKETVEAVHLFAPEHPELILPEDCGWRIAPLHTDSSPAPTHYPFTATVTPIVPDMTSTHHYPVAEKLATVTPIVPDTTRECAASG
jgi:hypothetical protein